MTKFAMVKFPNTDRFYPYLCDIKGLKKGDKIIVNSSSQPQIRRQGEFQGYIPEKYLLVRPKSKVIKKIKNDDEQEKTVEKIKIARNVRTKKQIIAESEILLSIISLFPEGLTSEQCGKLMVANEYNWKPQSFSTHIKTAMKHCPQIKNPQRDLYIHKKFLEVTKIG